MRGTLPTFSLPGVSAKRSWEFYPGARRITPVAPFCRCPKGAPISVGGLATTLMWFPYGEAASAADPRHDSARMRAEQFKPSQGKAMGVQPVYFGSASNNRLGVDSTRNFLTFGRETAAALEVEVGALSYPTCRVVAEGPSTWSISTAQ